MPESLIERLRPLWEAMVLAVRSDPSYVIEMAEDGKSRQVTPMRSGELEFSGV